MDASAETTGKISSEAADGFLSNEDFQRIRELSGKTGSKLLSSDQLSSKRVNPSTLEANIRRKQTKEEKNAVIRAVREERGKYISSTALKKKKGGGSSNLEKERLRNLPLAAKNHKISKTRAQKKIKQKRASKQFRGRKAWK